MPKIHTLLTLGLALILSACTSFSPGPARDTTYAFTLLHSNDNHGRFWHNEQGELGLAARKTAVDAIRAEVLGAGGHVLLLDAGDINTGIPESDLQDAVPDVLGMNLLRYDAMAVGNHEFDKSPAVLAMQRKLAQFPMLSANVYQGGARVFEPYRVFALGGVRVAVMGLTTPDSRKLGNPENMEGMEFRDPVAETAALLPEMRQKADVVIAASHLGYYEDGKHGQQYPGDVELARALDKRTKGLDVIVGGHSHTRVCMQAPNRVDSNYSPGKACQPDSQNGTWIVQAGEWGKYLGRADFQYRNGDLQLVKYELIPINLKNSSTPRLAHDPEMLALLQPYQDKGQEKINVPVGSSDGAFEGDRSFIRHRMTNLGMLIGTAMMDKTGADFAVLNAGGIRDSLPAGTLTYKDILKVHPFGNTLVTVTLTGREVMDYLQTAANMKPGGGSFAHITGAELHMAGDKLVQVRFKGKPVELDQNYRLVINNFVSVGGDGFPYLRNHPGALDTGFVDADVMREYIASHSPLQTARFAPLPRVAATTP